jgi:hypothetical protein
MSEKSLYFIIPVDLGEHRTESSPYEFSTTKDCLSVLSLTGLAEISINNGDFFDLAQEMKILLEKDKRKNIEIINTSQPGKNLIIFVGTQKKCQISL